jgi:hypothetical protein
MVPARPIPRRRRPCAGCCRMSRPGRARLVWRGEPSCAGRAPVRRTRARSAHVVTRRDSCVQRRRRIARRPTPRGLTPPRRERVLDPVHDAQERVARVAGIESGGDPQRSPCVGSSSRGSQRPRTGPPRAAGRRAALAGGGKRAGAQRGARNRTASDGQEFMTRCALQFSTTPATPRQG